jgi:hypothetical protein
MAGTFAAIDRLRPDEQFFPNIWTASRSALKTQNGPRSPRQGSPKSRRSVAYEVARKCPLRFVPAGCPPIEIDP